VPDAHQDAATDRVDEPLRGVEAGHQDQQCDQRRHAAARQHPVVDFQHEQRAGEHQNIAHAAEQRDGEEGPAAGIERDGEFRARRLLLPRRAWRLDHRSGACKPAGIISR
jgi:hypothetical protein